MRDLGTLGGASSSANAINGSGQVVGTSDAANGSAAFSWTAAGRMVSMGTLGGGSGSAFAVNDSGQAVGNSTTANGPFHAFSWTQVGGIVDLGTFGGPYSLAHAVNSIGEVVGWADTAGGSRHAFRWTSAADGLHDLGTLGGSVSEAVAVNDNGMVVGNSLTTNDAEEHAVAWSPNDQITDLGTLGGVFTKSDAVAVNNGGEVVGNSAQPGTSNRHAFVWNAANGMVDLGLLPGGGYSEAIAVNDANQIAGNATDASGVVHAVFWPAPDAPIVDLGPGPVFAMNNNGEVVGGTGGAFVWTQADGRTDLGNGVADAVNLEGQIAGGSQGHAALWQQQSPTAPSAPRNVVAAAGDGSASVSWVAPTTNADSITSYTVYPNPGGPIATVDGSTTTATVTGLTNGVAYTFTVIASAGNESSPSSAPSNSATPQAGAPPPAAASGSASPSSATTVSTGSDPAATGGTSTSLTVPSGTTGGPVSVIQSGTSEPTPSGYLLGGIQIDITAPPATPTNPLVLVFTFAPASGQTPDNAEIYRAEGSGSPTVVADCSGPPGQAVPDPCVSARQSVSVNKSSYIQLTVLSSTASHWNTARPKPGAVAVSDTGYSPQALTVQPGATVTWTFTGKKAHSATDTTPLGSGNTPWFDSGLKSSGSYSFAFPASGSFRYASTAKGDSMTGTVLVPDLVTPSNGGTATPYAIGWSTKLIAGYVFDIQYRFRPAKATGWKGWVSWKTGVSTTTGTFVPTQGAGTYAFHSRLRNIATGRASDYSPDTSLTAS